MVTRFPQLVATGLALTLLSVPTALPQAPSNSPPAKVAKPLFKPPNPPADEAVEKRAARAKLHTAYALSDGEVLKLVVPPFPPERTQWIEQWDGRNLQTRQAKHLGWVRNNRTIDECFEIFGTDEPSLLIMVALALRLRESEIEGPGRASLDKSATADVVIRPGITREQAVEPLARALRDQAGVPVRFALRAVVRDVWVARGHVKGDPSPGTESEKPILIYGTATPSSVTRHSGSWTHFFDSLSAYAGGQVIAADESGFPNQTVHYAVRRDRQSDPGAESDVMKRVAEQTGLTFKLERREVRVLVVDKAE